MGEEHRSDTMALFAEHIHWSVIDSTLRNLHDCHEYYYFLHGECQFLGMVENSNHIDISNLRYALSRIFMASIRGDGATVVHLINALYLSVLKPGLDFNAVTYVQTILDWVIEFEQSMLGYDYAERTGSFFTIENEKDYYAKTLRKTSLEIERKTISNVVLNSLAIMFERYDEDVFLEAVAKELSINKSYLSRSFSEQTGSTYHKILRSLRMKIANYYILNTRESIVNIARLVGYHDANYFGREYKKRFNISPLKARTQGKHSGEGKE